jgi:hypothetical protein
MLAEGEGRETMFQMAKREGRRTQERKSKVRTRMRHMRRKLKYNGGRKEVVSKEVRNFSFETVYGRGT